MILLYALKVTGLAAAVTVTEILQQGHTILAVAALPTLVSMWFATREHARRRAREREPS